VAGLHVEVAGEVDDAEAHAAAFDDAAAVARLALEEVRRPQDPLVRVQVGIDLALAVGVVAERDDVDAQREQLVGDLRRDARTARDVLAVDDDEVERMRLTQARQQRPQQMPSGRADEIADEEDRDGCGLRDDAALYIGSAAPLAAIPRLAGMLKSPHPSRVRPG
jgi:hypothetical protein